MFRSGFVLATDEHIAAAIHNKTEVTVWMEGGVIEAQTDFAVKINRDWHPEQFDDVRVCEFRVM
ncbi:hypothetical protein EBB07_03520 [Paenibacillaceae bacterium]|nr:hypothetical protein EBB07_03520 [Paenibacillaceae bacterium]